MEFDKEVDARGLNCPLPILRAKKALAEMQAGQVLRVLATDPGSVKDFAAFARCERKVFSRYLCIGLATVFSFLSVHFIKQHLESYMFDCFVMDVF